MFGSVATAQWTSEDPRTSAIVPYTTSDNAAIEQSYQLNPHGSHSLNVSGLTFTIDFSAMKQYNATGGQRRVFRAGGAALVGHQPSAAPPSVAVGARGGVAWESIDPRTMAITPYTAADSAAIEQSYQQNPNGSHALMLGGAMFRIDFQQMLQFNSNGGSRSVNRVGGNVAAPTVAPPSHALLGMTSSANAPLSAPPFPAAAAPRSRGMFGGVMQSAASVFGFTSASPQQPQSTTAPMTPDGEVSAILRQLDSKLVLSAVAAIAANEKVCDDVSTHLVSFRHSFDDKRTAAAAGKRDLGPVLRAGGAVDPTPIITIYGLILKLMAVGDLSASEMDFSASSGGGGAAYSGGGMFGHLFSIGYGQPVPSYFANAGKGDSIFQRKYLSLLGLRNLVGGEGASIFEELFDKLFLSDPAAYRGNAGLARMRRLTGNVVDLDTVVLNCETQLKQINGLLKDEKSKAKGFSSAAKFFASPEAHEMAKAQAAPVISSFIDLLQLSDAVVVQRRIDAATALAAGASIPVASVHTDRGKWPLWGYANVGVFTYHANVPHIPDIIGALLRAPFQLVKAFLMGLVAAKVLPDTLFSSSTPSAAAVVNATTVAAATIQIKAFFGKAVDDSCFNAKWKAIEAFVDEMTAMDDVQTVIGNLQAARQDIFNAALFSGDDDARTNELNALVALIQKGAVKARDPKTKQIRLLCKTDVEQWIKDTM